jgi:hypothetical protein
LLHSERIPKFKRNGFFDQVNIKRFVKQELAIRERMSSSGTEIEENKENDHSDGHKGSFDFFS